MNYFNVFIFSFLLLFVSCDNSDDNKEEENNSELTEELCADIVGTSISYDSYGFSAIVSLLASECQSNIDPIECGSEVNNSNQITYTTPKGRVSSKYDYEQTCTKNCSPEINFDYITSANHLIEGIHFKADNAIYLQGIVGGFDENISYFSLDGTYAMEGIWEEVLSKTKLDVNIEMEIIDPIQIKKSEEFNDCKVIAGSILFKLNANVVNRFVSMSVEGSISYVSELQARIDIKDGASYLIDLESGEVTEI